MNINFKAGELFEYMCYPRPYEVGLILKIENIKGVELIVHTQFLNGIKETFYNDSFVTSGHVRMLSPIKPLLKEEIAEINGE